jgi:RNA polymerase sigma factor (sigma-70 family)
MEEESPKSLRRPDMAADGPGASLRHLGQLFETGTVSGLSDPQLLQRFLTRHDEAAFEALVRKHGPMVLAVCRRRLSDPNDVDDAFQATFLVLIRRARDLRDPSRLASWLYGVAHKVAERARLNARKRRAHEQKAPPMPADSAHSTPFDDLAAPLHAEIRALPDRYRAPIVLCFLQGRTHEEAARELGWPLGSVKGRLARAKNLLRKKLMRRGISVPATLIASTLARDAAGSVPPALLHSTIKTALAATAAQPLLASALSGSAATLAQEVTQAMTHHHLRSAILALSALGLVGTGVGAYALQGRGNADPNPQKSAQATENEKTPDPDNPDNPRAVQAVIDLRDAKSRLAQVRTQSLLERYQAQRIAVFQRAGMGVFGMGMGGSGMGMGGMASMRMGGMSMGGNATGMGGAGVRGYAVSQNQDPSQAPRATIEAIKKVGETANDQLAAAGALIATIKRLEADAREALARKILAREANEELEPDRLRPNNPSLIEFEVDLAEAQVWLAELKADNPGVSPSPWGAEISKPPVPSEPAEDPEDAATNETILKALQQTVSVNFEERTPFSEIIAYVHEQTKSEALPDGIPIYTDPAVLQKASLTFDAPEFTLSLERVPLKTALQLLLNQRSLTYEVRKGLLAITRRPWIEPSDDNLGETDPEDWSRFPATLYYAYSPIYGLEDATPADKERTSLVEKALRQSIPMPFSTETPLKDALDYIREKTTNDTFPSGVPIYLDLAGLQDADKTFGSPVRIDLSGVRLKTTLELLLKQLNLSYAVRQGVLIITSPRLLESMTNPRDRNRFTPFLSDISVWDGDGSQRPALRRHHKVGEDQSSPADAPDNE